MALNHRPPRPAFGAFCALLALGLLAGCGGSGPNLRALNAREAKIEVFPNGEVRVLGERIEMGELSEVVKNSSTQPQDTVLIKLHGDPDSPEFVTLRKYVTDQMFRAGHLKFRFFSTPQASLSTYNRLTGETSTDVLDPSIKIQFSGAELHAEADRLAAEREAYKAGTYVSNAIGRRSVVTKGRPEELKIDGETMQDEAVPTPQATTPQAQRAAEAPAENLSLRERYLRQQRQLRGN